MAKKGDETKKMIIDAAAALFAEKGFKDVSMSDLCEKTGLSRGGLYRHFSSTGEIFRELITKEYSFDEQIERGDRALDILEQTIRFVEAELLKTENSLSLAIYEYATTGNHREEFPEAEEKAKKRWMRLIEYGISTGEFLNVDPEEVTEMILYYYQGLRMWSRVVNIGKKSAEFYRNNIFRLLTGGTDYEY